MFDNIGGKIKVLAKIFCWIGIIASVIFGIYTMADTDGTIGFLYLIGGAILSWISSFTLYGFGELVEAASETRDLTVELLRCKMSGPSVTGPAPVTVVRGNGTAQTNSRAQTNTTPADGWTCACGRSNASYVSTCVCGLTKHEAAKKIAESNKVYAEIRNGEKICPKCGTAQKEDREVCWSCGVHFEN